MDIENTLLPSRMVRTFIVPAWPREEATLGMALGMAPPRFGSSRFERRIIGCRNRRGKIELLCGYGKASGWYDAEGLVQRWAPDPPSNLLLFVPVSG